jgi:hypothetical protein
VNKQDELLKVLDNPENVDLLYDLWRIIQTCPSKAASILVQFKDVSTATKLAVADMQEALQRFNAIQTVMPELEMMAERIKRWQNAVKDIDERHVLNRASRILDMAKQISEIKKAGGLDLLEKLLSK